MVEKSELNALLYGALEILIMLDEKQIDLMRIIYFNYAKIKDLSLSKRQVEVVSWLKSKGATSRDFAEKFDICVQNASQQLSNLYHKGYLIREEKIDNSGGYYYEYRALPRLFECAF
jgi:predicted transcriptional regulator